MPNITNALKGIGGQYELNRLVGAFGGTVFIISTVAFMAWDVMWKGRDFDVVAYCLAFPGGIGAVVAAIAGAVAWKDKAVATAKVIETTGAQPGAAAPGVAPEPGK